LKHHQSGLFRKFGILVIFVASISGAASLRNVADEGVQVRASSVTCSDAEQILKSQWSRIQSDSGTILTLVQSEYACNQREGARHLATVLSEHSGDSTWWEAIFRGGQIAAAAGDFEMAEKLFQTIQKNYADQAALYFELGNVQLQAGRFGRAKVSYQRAAQADPSSPEIQLGLAGARTVSGAGEDALSGLEQAIQRFPSDPRFLIAYGDVLQQLPEYSEAVYQARAKRYLERAISVDHSSARAHYLLGQLLITESNPRDAVRELEIAIQSEPGFRQAHFALSRAYRRMGRVSEANEQFSLFQKLESAQTAVSGIATP
jgi:tetratricopeptide (TPR) repeat protein